MMSKGKIGILILVLLLIGSTGTTAFLFYKLKDKGPTGSPNESSAIMADISKVLILPQGETPTIATVSDLTKLGTEPFFKNAEVGDKVLLYAASKKAILWRPSTRQVVEMSPVVPAPATP